MPLLLVLTTRDIRGQVSIDEAFAAGETAFKKAGKKRGDPKQLGKAVHGNYVMLKGRATRLEDPVLPFRTSESEKAEGEPLPGRPQRNRSTLEGESLPLRPQRNRSTAEGEPLPLRPQRNRSSRAEQQQQAPRLPFTAHMLEKQKGMLQSQKSVSFAREVRTDRSTRIAPQYSHLSTRRPHLRAPRLRCRRSITNQSVQRAATRVVRRSRFRTTASGMVRERLRRSSLCAPRVRDPEASGRIRPTIRRWRI